ncbi:unnamed protein product, partial [marine sediment metagenome]
SDGVISHTGFVSKNGATTAGFLDLYEDSDAGTDKIKLISPALAADLTFTLPDDDGTSGQVLHTDGNGVMSWAVDDGAGAEVWAQVDDAADSTWWIAASGDTALILSSDEGGNITLKAGNEDDNSASTLHIKVDTLDISGDVIADFAGEGLSVTAGVLNAAAGATAYDDIGDPDASGSIAFGAHTATYTSATDGWGGVTIINTVADMTSADWLLTLNYTDDGDVDADFFRCLDNEA